MKFIFKLVLFMLLLGEADMLSAAEDKKLALISNGKSGYVIVIPDKDPQNKAGKAAKLLQSILSESTKCKLPIVKESAVPANTNHIYLGKTQAAEKAGIPFDKLIEWTFCKRVIGKDIYLAGNDASANLTGPLTHREREYLMQAEDHRLNLDIKDLSYKGFRGTYKAVSSFLEKQLGVRFLLPGPVGLHVPKHKTFEVSASINYLGSARFPFCYGRCYGDITVQNNQNEIPYYKNYGGHSFPVVVPTSKYAKDHPEYFVMVNGKRRPYYGPAGGGHLCISNPEVQELMMKELEQQYDKGFKWVQVAQTDGIVACQCDDCKALAKEHGYGDALWQVYLKIAKEMKKRRPGLKVVFLAYSVAAYAPKSFDSFPDNVIIDMCAYDKDFFDQWAKFKVPKLVYIYNWGEYHTTIFCPKRSLQFLAKQLRMFDKNHVKGIYKCSFGEAIGLDGPAYYVFSKLLEDPNQDPQKIADDFYRCAYGKAYTQMKAFFDGIYQRLDIGGKSALDLLYVNPRNPQLQISYLFLQSPDFLAYLHVVLNQGVRCAEDPKVKARIKLVKREFDYLRNLVQIYAYYDTYQLSRSKAAVKLLDQALKERDAMLDSWYDKDGKMIQEPGINWPFFYNVPKNIVRDGGGFICSPFPGLLAKMPSIRKSVGLPPCKTTSMETAAVPQPKGKIFEAVSLSPEEAKRFSVRSKKGIVPGTFGEPGKKVSFKVGYDKKNLYFAFSCRFYGISKAKFIPDRGNEYKSHEGVGIFLAPIGSVGKYYHFVFSPAANSAFESRYGFINDKLHPYYGKEDDSWSEMWRYSARIYNKKDMWTVRVKIPFKTLGVKPPRPGETWRMEIVRRHFSAGNGNPSEVDISSWTSNFNDGSCSASGFGTLGFK